MKPLRMALPMMFLLGIAPMLPAELVVQNGLDAYAGASDATLVGGTERQGALNYGHAESLDIAGSPSGGIKRMGVLQFSGLEKIAEPLHRKTIQQATLALYKTGEPKDTGQYDKSDKSLLVIKVFPLLRPWTAGTQAGDREEGTVTFHYRSYQGETPVFWGDASQIENGPVKEVDYNATLTSSAPLQPAEENLWIYWNVTPIVQQWLDDPASNHGLYLTARGYYIGAYFASCEAADPSLRPKLIIKY